MAHGQGRPGWFSKSEKWAGQAALVRFTAIQETRGSSDPPPLDCPPFGLRGPLPGPGVQHRTQVRRKPDRPQRPISPSLNVRDLTLLPTVLAGQLALRCKPRDCCNAAQRWHRWAAALLGRFLPRLRAAPSGVAFFLERLSSSKLRLAKLLIGCQGLGLN